VLNLHLSLVTNQLLESTYKVNVRDLVLRVVHDELPIEIQGALTRHGKTHDPRAGDIGRKSPSHLSCQPGLRENPPLCIRERVPRRVFHR
jgi:hypothetical protein